MAPLTQSLSIEKKLSHQTELTKPELQYDEKDLEDRILITTGWSCMSPCSGLYKVSKSTDKTNNIFTSLWTQTQKSDDCDDDDMIDPTQKDFYDADTGNGNEPVTVERKSNEFSNHEECVSSEIMKGMNSIGYVKVSKCVVFSRRELHCGFQGKIFISNICESYVTYRVSSSSAKKFRYFPDDIGWISPKNRREIFVQTNRLEATSFEDIASEVFQVQATAIYHKEQLDMTCLNTLWKAYGTEMFPNGRCEHHLIKDVYPKDYDYLENISLLGHLQFAFFKKIKAIEQPTSTSSEGPFYEQWPVNSQSYTVMNEEMEDVWRLVKEVEECTTNIFRKLACLFLMIFIFLGVSFATYSFFYGLSDVLDHVSCVIHNCIDR